MAEITTPQPYRQTNHDPEIFPRRRTFTPEEHQWRKATASFLWERLQNIPAASPASGVLRERRAIYNIHSSPTDKKAKKEAKRKLREDLTDILLILRLVNEILKVRYSSPDWGNQPHIIDELVYILLTRRSKIEDAKRHFEAIKAEYPDWETVAFAPPKELKAVITGGGLEDDRVKLI